MKIDPVFTIELDVSEQSLLVSLMMFSVGLKDEIGVHEIAFAEEYLTRMGIDVERAKDDIEREDDEPEEVLH